MIITYYLYSIVNNLNRPSQQNMNQLKWAIVDREHIIWKILEKIQQWKTLYFISYNDYVVKIYI